MRSRARLFAILVFFAGCASEQANLHDRADKTRKAMPACDGGNAQACTEACMDGGPNKSCQRACDAGHAPSCASLAYRLEHEIDVDDAEAPSQKIPPSDPELITGLYEQACRGGFGAACQPAGMRMLNGIGRGRRNAGVAVEMLKLGCERWHDAESCCSMSQLNLRLAEGNNVNQITDFRDEARKWAILAERNGGSCPAPAAPAATAAAPSTP